MKGIDDTFRKIVAIDNVIFLPLCIILIGIIIYAAWRLNKSLQNELKDEREKSAKDRDSFLDILNKHYFLIKEFKNTTNNKLQSISSNIERVERQVEEIKKDTDNGSCNSYSGWNDLRILRYIQSWI